MTGWGEGYCSGSQRPGFLGRIFGQGRGSGGWGGFGRGGGRGGGGGRGRRNRFRATDLPGRADTGSGPIPASAGALTQEQEAGDLRKQVKLLEKTLSKMKDRLTELEAGMTSRT